MHTLFQVLISFQIHAFGSAALNTAFEIPPQSEDAIPECVDVDAHAVRELLANHPSVPVRGRVILEQQSAALWEQSLEAVVKTGKSRLAVPQCWRRCRYPVGQQVSNPIFPLGFEQDATGNGIYAGNRVVQSLALVKPAGNPIQHFIRAGLGLRAAIPRKVADEFALQLQLEHACLFGFRGEGCKQTLQAKLGDTAR